MNNDNFRKRNAHNFHEKKGGNTNIIQKEMGSIAFWAVK